jgi:hypothetical protein
VRYPEGVAPVPANEGQIVPKVLMAALAVACIALCVIWFK